MRRFANGLEATWNDHKSAPANIGTTSKNRGAPPRFAGRRCLSRNGPRHRFRTRSAERAGGISHEITRAAQRRFLVISDESGSGKHPRGRFRSREWWGAGPATTVNNCLGRAQNPTRRPGGPPAAMISRTTKHFEKIILRREGARLAGVFVQGPHPETDAPRRLEHGRHARRSAQKRFGVAGAVGRFRQCRRRNRIVESPGVDVIKLASGPQPVLRTHDGVPITAIGTPAKTSLNRQQGKTPTPFEKNRAV